VRGSEFDLRDASVPTPNASVGSFEQARLFARTKIHLAEIDPGDGEMKIGAPFITRSAARAEIRLARSKIVLGESARSVESVDGCVARSNAGSPELDFDREQSNVGRAASEFHLEEVEIHLAHVGLPAPPRTVGVAGRCAVRVVRILIGS
jgi:hypothetical protein